MNTFRSQMIDLLGKHGLWLAEAQTVVAQAEADPNDPMKGRWGDDGAGYPPQVTSMLWMSVKRMALEHLKKTNPNHFAIAVLSDGELEVPV